MIQEQELQFMFEGLVDARLEFEFLYYKLVCDIQEFVSVMQRLFGFS